MKTSGEGSFKESFGIIETLKRHAKLMQVEKIN